VPVDHKFCLVTKHGLNDVPDHLLSVWLDIEQLRKLKGGLGCSLQYSPKEEVEWQDLRTFLIVLCLLIFSVIGLSLLEYRTLLVFYYFDNARAFLPSKLAYDSNFQLSEMYYQFSWHVIVDFKEDVEESP
jgi:hypothetical protein